MRLIPHWILPGFWGLKGKTLKRAIAEYYFEPGEALERELAAIEYSGEALADALLSIDLRWRRKTPYEVDLIRGKVSDDDVAAQIELKLKHGIGDPYALKYDLIEATYTDQEARELAKIDVDLEYGVIDELDHQKLSASVRRTPWIGIRSHSYDPMNGLGGLTMEFDWNEEWIEYLRLNGYAFPTEEAAVEAWFQDLNRQSALDAMGFPY